MLGAGDAAVAARSTTALLPLSAPIFASPPLLADALLRYHRLRTIRHADSFSSGSRLARRLCHVLASQTHCTTSVYPYQSAGAQFKLAQYRRRIAAKHDFEVGLIDVKKVKPSRPEGLFLS